MGQRSGNQGGARVRRKAGIRKHVSGTPQRPRLNVFRSARHIYAQVIDDVAGETLAAASTLTDRGGAAAQPGAAASKKTDSATRVGAQIAAACRAKDIVAVAFDRNGFRYHGRVKAIAEAARAGGLKF